MAICSGIRCLSILSIISVFITGLTLGQETVRQADLQGRIAVCILKQSTALNTIRVGDAIQLITPGEMHRPLYSEVQTRSDLELHTGTDGEVTRELTAFSSIGLGSSQAEEDKRCDPSRSPIVMSCPIGPEIIFIAKAEVNQFITERLQFLRLQIFRLHILWVTT